jgi:hypothetical protein
MVAKFDHCFCFAGFGTDGLRRQEAMKTAGIENPIHGVTLPRNRADGAVGQNRSRSIKWAAKQEKFQPKELCFFLTSPFTVILTCIVVFALFLPERDGWSFVMARLPAIPTCDSYLWD